MRKWMLVISSALLFAATATQAEDVQYVLETPGVTWGGSSAKARAAAEALGVGSVKADMDTHTVRVVFDNASMSIDDVVAALTEAGCAVPKYDLVNLSADGR